MLPARRRRYLEALSLEQWMLRTPAAFAAEAAPAAVAAPAPSSAPPAVAQRSQALAPSPAVPVPLPVPAPMPLAMSERRSPAPPAEAPLALPADWEGLRALVGDCRRCPLCRTRTQTVFGVGAQTAPLMVVGEGPGADEDAQGEPFVGRAGKLLDEMLRAIGRSRRDNVYIANVVKCRPPGNRDPETEEAEACRPYLEQQIALLRPRLIVALGRVAAQRLLRTDEALSRLRSPLHRYGPDGVPLLITYHPAYLLRSPREKAKSWEDLKRIHRFLAQP